MNRSARNVCFISLVSILMLMFSACGATLPNVKVIKLKKQSLEAFAYASASVQPKEVETIYLQDGVRVTQLHVEEGQLVSVGQRLVSTDNNKTRGSSIDGVVTELNVATGMQVNATVPVMRVVDVRNLVIKAQIAQKDVSRVLVDQEVLLYGDGIPRDKRISGSIQSIGSIANTIGDQTYVDATILLKGQEPPFLKVGMSVQCEIKISQKDDILVTTLDTIKEIGSDKYVFIYENGAIKETAVETGAEFGIKLEVMPASGLKEGQYLVLDPLPEYITGMQVNAVEVSY
jgi:multidrug efflux pump subunit AcrA (membrane-fusion protein)